MNDERKAMQIDSDEVEEEKRDISSRPLPSLTLDKKKLNGVDVEGLA